MQCASDVSRDTTHLGSSNSTASWCLASAPATTCIHQPLSSAWSPPCSLPATPPTHRGSSARKRRKLGWGRTIRAPPPPPHSLSSSTPGEGQGAGSYSRRRCWHWCMQACTRSPLCCPLSYPPNPLSTPHPHTTTTAGAFHPPCGSSSGLSRSSTVGLHRLALSRRTQPPRSTALHGWERRAGGGLEGQAP